jgi:hypothetical protein
MDKKELLEQIQSLAAQQLITKEEVASAFDEGSRGGVQAAEVHQAGISHLLYYIGGAVVFLGISVLIWQHWASLNSATKILSTLGSGIASYFAAVFLSREERLEVAGRAFYFIAALVMPLGLHVTFDIAGMDTGSYGAQSIISGILFTTFVLSYLANPRTVFALFNIIFGTWLFFSFTSFLVGGRPNFGWEFSAYRVLCTGLAYALFGYYFTGTPRRSLTGALYGFGALCFLGAALALSDWKPHQNWFWELIFPGLVFGVMFLSVYLKSKAFLTFGSLYLVAYIFKITAEYFADSLGWPLVLVLTGLGLIAIGYLHFSLKRKYLS